MRGVRPRAIVGVAALALVAAACGSDSNQPATGSGGTGGTGGTAAGGGSEPGPGSLYGGGQGMTGSTGSTGTTGANADVSVSLNNYLLDPAVVKVTSGDVVAVRNGNARTPHTFTVVGENVDLELAPLTTKTVTIDLQPRDLPTDLPVPRAARHDRDAEGVVATDWHAYAPKRR